MFRIKICGITQPADALIAANAGADAIGVNFFTGSKRCVVAERAAQILHAASGLQNVGVFVNAAVDDVNQLARTLGLDWVQLHGDESPSYLLGVTADVKIIRVYRAGSKGIEYVVDDVATCRQSGRLPDAVMLDALACDSYGGTGQTVNWAEAARLPALLSEIGVGELPWILAGGLSPENIAAAIDQTKPSAVDVASGVEASPAKKDAALVQSFTKAAAQAFRQVGQRRLE